MDVTSNLTPFWHEIPDEGDPDNPVRFFLKPLTEPQVNELWRTFERLDGSDERRRPTEQTWYRAGVMALSHAGVKIENLTIDGKKARWPRDRDTIPERLVIDCGIRVCNEAWPSEDAEGN